MDVAWTLALLALVGSALVESLLYGQRAGPGWFALVVATALAIHFVLRRMGRRAPPWASLLWMPPLAFGLSLYLFDADVVHGAAPQLCLLTLLIAAYWTFQDRLPLAAFARPLPLPLVCGVFESLGDIVPAAAALQPRGPQAHMVRRLLLGVVAAIPMLVVFGALFYMSDDVYRRLLDNAGGRVSESAVWSLLRILALSALLLGFLTRLVRGVAPAQPLSEARQEDPVVWGVAIGLVNFLFLSFLVVQARYLFGGEAMIALPGVTYAEYARKGFFELATVTVLVFGVVALVYRATHAQESGGLPMTLSGLLILQTFLVAGSALKRMSMYTDAYGMSVQRFYAAAGMVCMLVLLVIVLVSIVKRAPMPWVVSRAWLAVLFLLAGLSLVDVDRTVARVNVDRARLAQGPMDVTYLGTLSADAAPEVARLLGASDATVRAQAESALASMAARTATNDWRSLTLGRVRARPFLEPYRGH